MSNPLLGNIFYLEIKPWARFSKTNANKRRQWYKYVRKADCTNSENVWFWEKKCESNGLVQLVTAK